jgi:ech hydrogenase subunit D
MATEIINIEKSALLGEVQTLKNKGYRLVTMSSVNFEDSFDLLYHFDKELQMKNLRVSLPKGESMPSISGIYLAGFLIENEIKDGFGIDFTGLAIDFGGNLILEDEVQKYPFCSVSVKKKPAKAKKEDA